MPSLFDSYFPDQAVWAFKEKYTNAEVSLRVSTHTQGGRRQIELDAGSSHVFRAFFDRLTITDAGLELNRFRVGSQTLDIRPPLVITTGAQHDHVGNLFPGYVGTFPMASPPYDGTVVSKAFVDVAATTTSPPDRRWVVHISSHAKEGREVFNATFEFGWGGLVSYTGQVYGVFFQYDRVDLGHVAPAPAAPHSGPAPVHPTPPPHTTLPHKPPAPPPPPPIIHTPESNAKDVSDARNDPNLLKQLIKRAKSDPDLDDRLVRAGFLKPKSQRPPESGQEQ